MLNFALFRSFQSEKPATSLNTDLSNSFDFKLDFSELIETKNLEAEHSARSKSTSLKNFPHSECSFSQLPIEVVSQIFSYLSTNFMVKNLRPLCVEIYDYTESPLFWQKLDFQDVKIPISILQKIIRSRSKSVSFRNCDFCNIEESDLRQFLTKLSTTIEKISFYMCKNLKTDVILKFCLAGKLKNLIIFNLVPVRCLSVGTFETTKLQRFLPLRKISLRNIRLDPSGWENLVQLLKKSSVLCKICLGGTYPNRNSTKEILSLIAHQEKVEVLDINNWTYVNLESLKNILECHEMTLRKLSLRGISVVNDAFSKISSIRELTWLDISDITEISDKELALISNFVKLKLLNLNGTNVTSNGIKNLSDLSIESLFLAETKIDNEVFSHLLPMQTLKVIDISNNFISNCPEILPKFLCKMVNLEKIGLYGFESLVIEVAKSYNLMVMSNH